MKDIIIKYDTAVLSREKGFNEHCDFLYNEKGEIETVGNYNYLDDEKYVSYSAPTQNLLQKWLREKHYIYVTPLPSYTDNSDNKKYNCEVFKGKKLKLLEGSYFKSYEESLEKGLLYALQMI